jgi:hypothetical protein
MTTSPRYAQALAWAEQLHRHQQRRGKDVPFLSHLISVSALVWEDGGDENQAVAALLHDSIEEAGQTHASIRERFGEAVANIVLDCTDPGKLADPATRQPWVIRKLHYIAGLDLKPDASLLVAAADKAHNAHDQLLDAGPDPDRWNCFVPRFDGSAWYFWSLHNQFKVRLPESRSVKLLGQSVEAILTSPSLLARLPVGLDPHEWVANYMNRPKTHPET